MIETIVKAIILGVVLLVVYYLLGLLITTIGFPPVLVVIIGILLVLAYLIWLIRAFGINF